MDDLHIHPARIIDWMSAIIFLLLSLSLSVWVIVFACKLGRFSKGTQQPAQDPQLAESKDTATHTETSLENGGPIYRTFVLDWHSLKNCIYSSAFPPLAQGSSQVLALPTTFPMPSFSYLCGYLMLSCPKFHGAKPAHNYFQPCPKSLHSPERILKACKGLAQPFWN